MMKCVASLTFVIALFGLGDAANASERLSDSCAYRQAAMSLPAAQVSSADVGHPWRAMYGYCLRGGQRFVLHQDWVLSYLDAKSFAAYRGGNGIGVGTDLLLRWHPDWRPSLVPYIDVGGGLQFAAGTAFPADGSRWMFALHAGAGWLIPLRDKHQANIAIRYLHISNAGLVSDNSGYDVIHLVLGIRWGSA